MQTSLPLYTPFPDGIFDRVKKDYARIEEENEIKRIDYYKRRNAGLKAYNTRLMKQFKK